MSCPSRLKGAIALLILLCTGAAQAADDADVLIVDLYLNQQPMGDTFVLQDEDGSFLVAESVLLEWQISRPWPESTTFLGENYYAIDQFPGASAELIPRRMELRLSMPAKLMPMRTVGLRKEQRATTIEDYGAYLDYDFNWLRQESNGNQSTHALLRPVIFGPGGNLAADLNYRNLSRADSPGSDTGHGLHVLSLTYTRDDPERLRSLRVGDVITYPGTQGRALRIGGIQLATNFGTQPTFITYPLPDFYGETAVPSALDIYINGRLSRTEEVQPGRYVLEDIPVVNGAGQMQVVARDALGRQQVFAQDFYVSSELLREGLNDYSLNIGALREDYGVENFSYGAFAGTANWRHGLNNDLTFEGHTEFSDGLFMLGGGAHYAVKNGGTLRGSLGLSTGDAGFGTRWQLGFRQISNLLNYNAEVSGSTRNFDLVGSYLPLPKMQALASAGKSFYEYGSFGASVVYQSFHDQPSRTLISANHSKTFRNFLSLSTFVSWVDAAEDSFTAGIRFSMPFGGDFTTHGGLSGGDSGINLETVVRRNMPVGTGYGYHVGMARGEHDLVDAGVIAQNDFGTYTLDVRDSGSAGRVWQAGVFGSVAYLDGMTKASRRIRDAFAVVDVGGVEGVRVYAENQEIGRTNSEGKLFVPGLQPYYRNQLRIEVDDLPLNARIGNTRADTLPFYRSGVVVNFDVRIANNVMFRAVLPDGNPVPEGAVVRVRYPNDLLPVGMDGQVYLEGIDRSSLIEIRWNGMSCELDVPFPSSNAVITRLDDIICEPQPVR